MVENLAYLFDPSNTEPPCDPPQNAAQRRMPQHNRRTTAAQPPHSRRTAAAQPPPQSTNLIFAATTLCVVYEPEPFRKFTLSFAER